MNLLYRRVGGREGIFNLLTHFYADVRQDPLIGPIFNAQVQDWKEHFERWLFLWHANCRVQLPTDVAQEMIDLAHHIGGKLRLILRISGNDLASVRPVDVRT